MTSTCEAAVSSSNVFAGDEEHCIVFFRGFAALSGKAIERIATAGLVSIPNTWQQKRAQLRAEDGFHVTLLTKADLQTLAQKLRDETWPAEVPKPKVSNSESIAQSVADLVAKMPGGFVWADAGEGHAGDQGGEAAFRVILWPGGAAVRRQFGLAPHDFHVTLGFVVNDVHDRPKGLTSLVGGTPEAACLPGLITAAERLLAVGTGRNTNAEGVESLAAAALAGAEASEDTAAEAAALGVLCQLCGRMQQWHKLLGLAERLVHVDEASVAGRRNLAITLMALGRHAEAQTELRHLHRLLCRMEPDDERDALLKWLHCTKRTCHSKLGESVLFPGPEPEGGATQEQDDEFNDSFLRTSSDLKFPSTAHLKNLGAATRDDKVCDVKRQRLFCGGGYSVSVEEKIDGANLGLSITSIGEFRMQARSKLVNWKTDLQFAGLERWLEEHRPSLCELLEPNNDILFGEWCAFRHTVKYTHLPAYFLAFDIYDRRARRFLSRVSFHSRLARVSGAKIPAVPTLCTSRTFASTDEVETFLQMQSTFADEVLEGVYLRVDQQIADPCTQESYLEDRCKLVRREFQQSIDDEGTWRGRGKNELDMELAMSYAERSYPCAMLSATQGRSVPQAAAVCSSASSSAVAPASTIDASKDNYPSTPHLPFSPGVNPDDTSLPDCAHLISKEVLVTEKLDGGNCCIKGGLVFARSHAQPATHESFSAIKQLAQSFAGALGDIELYGENVQGVHSIEYTNLTSYFYVFAARRGSKWLSWDEVSELAESLGVPTVPVLYRGWFDSSAQLQSCLEKWATETSAVGMHVNPEGFVVRQVNGFENAGFADNIAKYVRANHIQTDDAWKRKWKKAVLGTALPQRSLRSLGGKLSVCTRITNPRERHCFATPGVGEVKLPRNFSFLMEDMAVSSTPKGAEQIAAMAAMDIALIVTLTEEQPLPPEMFAGSTVRNLFVPVTNYHPPTVPQMDFILAQLASVADVGKKMMVHCGGGKGRAGTVAACCLLRFGTDSIAAGSCAERSAGCIRPSSMQSDGVLRYLRDARPGSVETERQESFIRDYASLLWRRSSGEEIPCHTDETVHGSPDNEDTAVAPKMCVERTQNPQVEQQHHQHEQQPPAAHGGRAKREEREQEKRLRDLQKRAPKYIIMSGLAGSGKSTFSKALEATGQWTRANQDDLGRKKCEQLVGQTAPIVRQGKTRLVIDRCNLKRRERAEWLDMMGGPAPKDTICIFFDFSPEECKRRAAARMDHPTIRSGGGARIIEEQSQQLERPTPSEGFGVVEVIRSFSDAQALLRRFGAAVETPVSDKGAATVAAAVSLTHTGEQGATKEVASSSTVEAPSTNNLSTEFLWWLRTAVREELEDFEAEAALASAEVILENAQEDPDAVQSAEDILRGFGAPLCASSLSAAWSRNQS